MSRNYRQEYSIVSVDETARKLFLFGGAFHFAEQYASPMRGRGAKVTG